MAHVINICVSFGHFPKIVLYNKILLDFLERSPMKQEKPYLINRTLGVKTTWLMSDSCSQMWGYFVDLAAEFTSG